MKFIVSRTSIYGDEKPCDEAVQESYVRVDERNTDDPTKIPAAHGKSGWWYNEGRNHRVENGRIKRDFDAQAWMVEINTLDELLAFTTKYGDVVLGPSMWNSSMLGIEIYDDYRE